MKLDLGIMNVVSLFFFFLFFFFVEPLVVIWNKFFLDRYVREATTTQIKRNFLLLQQDYPQSMFHDFTAFLLLQ